MREREREREGEREGKRGRERERERVVVVITEVVTLVEIALPNLQSKVCDCMCIGGREREYN